MPAVPAGIRCFRMPSSCVVVNTRTDVGCDQTVASQAGRREFESPRPLFGVIRVHDDTRKEWSDPHPSGGITRSASSQDSERKGSGSAFFMPARPHQLVEMLRAVLPAHSPEAHGNPEERLPECRVSESNRKDWMIPYVTIPPSNLTLPRRWWSA